MNQNQSDKTKEINMMDLLFIILAEKKTILLTVICAVIIGLVLVFTVPRQYKSIARVLQPKQSNMLSGISGLTSLMRSLPGGLSSLGKNDDPYDYVAILRSRTVTVSVIKEFDLLRAYDITSGSQEDAIKELTRNIEIDWTEENTLEIRVWDYDAKKAASIANYYVEILNKRSHELQTQEASNTRMFIEQRVNQNQEELAKAEQAIKAYQEKEGMVIPFDVTSGGITSFAELYAQKVKNEIGLDIHEKMFGVNNEQYKQKKLELETLSKKISKFPELGISSLRLYREVVIQQKVMELLVPLYEQAKVNEHKDVPVAYILDQAVPGERPDRPRRLYIVGIATFLGIVVAFFTVSAKAYIQRFRKEQPERWRHMQSLLYFSNSGKE